MAKITPGSTIIGKSGKRFIVDRIDGDVLYCGSLKILASAVVEVIPPPTSFKIHDRVRYVGEKYYLKKQYEGELTIWEISKHDDGYACLKPDGCVTSWISFQDLELHSLTPHSSPSVSHSPLTIGDRVKIIPTGERGRLGLWDRNRRLATIELDDGTISDWVSCHHLRQIYQEEEEGGTKC